MLLDNFMPNYDFNEIHLVRIHATPSTIFEVVKKITALEIPPLRSLFSVRLFPQRLADKTAGLFTTSRPLFEQALRSGFVLLTENPNEEFVLGWVGQFWKLRGGSSPKIANAHEFVIFDTPGYAKAAINFRVERGNHESTLSTETRIRATDPIARRKFAAYWRVIHPGSGLVRRMWLKAIKRRAEGDS